MIHSGALGGAVTEIGITYVHLDTGERVLALPNSQVSRPRWARPGRNPGRPAGLAGLGRV